jgi:hypothetical protein
MCVSLSPCSPFLIDARSPRSVRPSKNTLRQTPKKKKETYVAGLAAQPPHKRKKKKLYNNNYYHTTSFTTTNYRELPPLDTIPFLFLSLEKPPPKKQWQFRYDLRSLSCSNS